MLIEFNLFLQFIFEFLKILEKLRSLQKFAERIALLFKPAR